MLEAFRYSTSVMSASPSANLLCAPGPPRRSSALPPQRAQGLRPRVCHVLGAGARGGAPAQQVLRNVLPFQEEHARRAVCARARVSQRRAKDLLDVHPITYGFEQF